MSWGKFLLEDIVIPSTYTFAWHEGATHRSVDVTAATYDDVLHVAATLQTALRAMGGGHTTDTVAISQVGKCTITVSGMTAQRWDATTDALSTLLGFTESEAVSGGALVSTNGHDWGWYPGVITHNYSTSRGAGLVAGAFWAPVDHAVRQWSGSGRQRTVKTARGAYRRSVRFDVISTDEVVDLSRGVAVLWDELLDRRFRWYLDRSDGIVGSYGTAGDPSTHIDSTCDYYVVSLAERPEVSPVAGSGSRFQVDLVLNGEPTT